jgi:outer membrane lipopolysaccharide assembly protein LptE/RlpB
VLNLKGEVLFSDEAFAYRDRQMDPQGLMAANQELYEINQQMANEIAEQIVRRIQFMATPR